MNGERKCLGLACMPTFSQVKYSGTFPLCVAPTGRKLHTVRLSGSHQTGKDWHTCGITGAEGR